jgi:hypothetical protein
MLAAALALTASTAAAADQMYFSATTDVSALLVQKINAETVRIDMSCWYLSDDNVASALLSRFQHGVPVRLIGDRASIFEIDQPTRVEFYRLAAAGVPIRLRYNPTWYPEIDHIKATVFVGQNLVAFGSANYSPYELTPFSPTNYHDETTMFSTDPTLVGAFETKFDTYWHDTAFEPESIYGGPPYFKNWADACALETACSDWKTQYPNPAPMNINTARLAPDNPMPSDLIWGQGPDFNDRIVQEINAESSHIDFTIYRLTVDNITNAILAKFQAGVPIRLITEPQEYLNRAWPEFWITHANEDKLWAAGVPMKQRQHDGLTHMKTLITSTYATNASSNNAAAWQRDNDYFINVSTKPDMYTALQNRFNAMWNDTSGFVPFVPLGPDTPSLSSPSNGQTAVSTTPTLVWTTATFATNYDVYLGTSSTNLSVVANVPAQIVNNPPSTYSWTPSSALQGGTTYFWKIVARTNATPRNPNLIGPTSVRSFTTGGSSGGGGGDTVPSPWQTQDVGSTGLAGSASASSGTFTLKGAGADIWGSVDAFRFVYQPVSGDTQIVARAASLTNTHPYAKAGVMLRASTAANSAMVIVDMTPSGNVEFMARSANGGDVQWIASSNQPAPAWLRLTRSGNTVTGSVSSNGSNWVTIASTTVSFTSANIGMLAMSHDTSQLTTAVFDNVTVGGGSPPPPPPPAADNIVIYGTDVPGAALHGWTTASDATAAGGLKLVTADAGQANTNAPLATPSQYFDVTFSAQANTPYTIWLRLQALSNSKFNDAVWVQFSDARSGGSPVYGIGTSEGLLVNLATDGGAASLNKWGWQNGAYWLSQATTVTFPTTGTHTIRVQIREDGVQLDQIVLSPSQYLTAAPGGPTNDSTIVPKP